MADTPPRKAHADRRVSRASRDAIHATRRLVTRGDIYREKCPIKGGRLSFFPALVCRLRVARAPRTDAPHVCGPRHL